MTEVHAAVAAVLLQREAAGAADREIPEGWGETLVESRASRPGDVAALPEKEKVLLRFVDRVNHDSPRITAADMKPLYQAGWTDDAIYYAITVCALYSTSTTVGSTRAGVYVLSDEAHRQGGVRSANAGYVQKVASMTMTVNGLAGGAPPV